ncbi:hypothetical protein BC749_10363 [Flavobacterium araucananum]|uniref:Uncharacterized protein n=1 Tax=Flavobacterium araucananum TaxID=946678 RepID=A0A227PGW6_9FLAO|nr:hypothetical protein [Flavobacterium araucananum]OXG09119.1 hypothetical protein B0A64_03755 [Flavobacterium araucananum]PWJ99685.1 hypothetical protein BC749_10363 [Flavobacterium araucananum]
MDTSNLKNKTIFLFILILMGCKREYTCKEYVLSYNYTSLQIERINENEIKNLRFFVKRNDSIINKGHLEVIEKLSKNRTLVKFKFFKVDTIYKTDTIYLNLKNASHYITGTEEVCVETTVGAPFIKVYKIDGVEFTEGEGFLKN